MPDSYQSIRLTTYSKDKMAFQDVALCLIDKQLYNQSGSGKGKVSGYPLPEDLNTFFIENVFNKIEK